MSGWRRIGALIGVLVLGVVMSAAPAQAGPDGRNYIWNDGQYNVGGIGVIHIWDGDYTQGLYDTVLGQNRYSSSEPIGWSYTEGFYIGPGYCAQIWYEYYQDDDWTRYSEDIHGPYQYHVSRYWYWMVRPYKAKSSSSCV